LKAGQTSISLCCQVGKSQFPSKPPFGAGSKLGTSWGPFGPVCGPFPISGCTEKDAEKDADQAGPLPVEHRA
jgi:hypothetical protein